jgi:hypothetical protein
MFLSINESMSRLLLGYDQQRRKILDWSDEVGGTGWSIWSIRLIAHHISHLVGM